MAELNLRVLTLDAYQAIGLLYLYLQANTPYRAPLPVYPVLN